MNIWLPTLALVILGSKGCTTKPPVVNVPPSGSSNQTKPNQTPRAINARVVTDRVEGAGSTFAEPIYQMWFSTYMPEQPVKFYYNLDLPKRGSEEGVKSLLEGTVHFAASDWPLTESEESLLTPSTVGPAHLYVPAIIGAVSPIYQLRDVNGREIAPPIRFTATALAGIFDGSIRRWDNPAIQGVNPNVRLPRANINVITREDGSGTTYVFATFLKRKGGWSGTPGMKVDFRSVQRVNGSEAMVDAIGDTSNSIGYVEYSRAAVSTRIRVGSVLNPKSAENRAPSYLTPNPTNMAAAVPDNITSSPVLEPAAFAVSVIDNESAEAYPISGITWFVVPIPSDKQSQSTSVFRDFLCWMLDSGQIPARSIGYSQLPARIRKPAKDAIERYFGACPQVK